MPRLAVTVLAYAFTVALAIAAALAHPWFDTEHRFVKAVSDWSRVVALDSQAWLSDEAAQAR